MTSQIMCTVQHSVSTSGILLCFTDLSRGLVDDNEQRIHCRVTCYLGFFYVILGVFTNKELYPSSL